MPNTRAGTTTAASHGIVRQHTAATAVYNRRIVTRRTLACLFALLVAAPAAAEWRRLDTPNFVVIGNVNPRHLRTIAVEFEGFRETLSRVLSTRATSTAVPTVVIVFSDEGSFAPFRRLYEGKPIRSAGYFHSDRDFNYITVLNDARSGGMRIIFHEYAHLVLSNIAMNLPAWLNEGLSEYYSTYEVGDGGREATIGRPVENHVRLLSRVIGERGLQTRQLSRQSLLPLEELIQVDQSSPLYNEGQRRSVFYAQSWALTHMLMQGPRARELAAFIGHKRDGLSDADAWRRAFGDAPLHRELQLYLRRLHFNTTKYRFAEGFGSFDGTSTDLSEADSESMLAGLHVRQRRYDEAGALAGKALERDPRHQLAHVLMARVESERGRHAAAVARVMGLGTVTDWLVAYTAGVTLSQLIDDTRDPSADRLERARAYFDTVRRSRGDMANVLAQLVVLDLMSGEGPTVNSQAAIERARALAPGRDDYALLHARVLAERGELAVAQAIIEPMTAPGFPAHIRDTAREWMGNIARAREGGSRRTFYRARGPGEERLEGLLERVDCPVESPAAFHVRAGGNMQTLLAPTLHEIELITYRRDITRNMICGAWKEPAPVYVTWKPGSQAGVKFVVAVEFLPR